MAEAASTPTPIVTASAPVPDPSKLPAAWTIVNTQVKSWRAAGKTDTWIKGQCCGKVYFALGGK
jgi:hypothetical protein